MTKQVRVTICYIVLIAFVAAVIGTFAWATSGFKNWNAKTWFDYWGKGAPTVNEPVKPDDKPDNGGSLITGVTNNGIKLTNKQVLRSSFEAMGISEHADSAYIITATVEPENASNKIVTFRAEWNDVSSAWATGKTLTDYVVLTADGNTATVTCLQAFGETVKITCVSNDAANINAVCTLDYAKRIAALGLKLTVQDGASSANVTTTEKGLDSYPFLSHHYYGLVFTPEYSIGTVNDKFEYTGYFEKTNFSSGKYTGGTERWEVPTNLVFSDSAMLDEMFSLSPPGTQYFYDMCAQASSNNVGVVCLCVTAAGEYSEYMTWYEFRVNKDSFKVNVTGVSLSHSALVF